MAPSPTDKQEDQKVAVTSQKLSLATHYHQTGRLKDAEQLYQNILVEQPNHAEVNSNMGVLASQTGRVNDALCFFQAALSSDPKNGQTWA
ncbi:tetratricopeptide repeat protein, partial [Acidithiobacillus caldus]